eukprot:scaffold21186_cov67-Phaeocystis_antarctica.AAC.3
MHCAKQRISGAILARLASAASAAFFAAAAFSASSSGFQCSSNSAPAKPPASNLLTILARLARSCGGPSPTHSSLYSGTCLSES